ncbi:MAG: hypothetical protein F9K18_01140 [Thermoanaerobaculia bacterium]|nr:MAG: hypothetical protein F9K18_01140 [Thermoanaerobaculia bacterium]
MPERAGSTFQFTSERCAHCGCSLRRSDAGALSCGDCGRTWPTNTAYVEEVESATLAFAIENQELGEGTGTARARLSAIFRTLLRRLEPSDMQQVARMIGRVAHLPDATALAILDEEARIEAERLRSQREAVAR